VVDERRRVVADLAELVHGDRAVPLRQLLAVLAVHVRDMAVDRQVGSERPQDLDLLGRVRDVVGAAQDVRDPVLDVLDRRGEVVGRPAVGAQEHEVLDRLVRDLDAAEHDVVPGGRALVGHAEADRSLVFVGQARLDELVCELAAALHVVELERNRAVPVQPEPAQRLLDLLGRLEDLARSVRVLDPEQELAALVARKEPVEERRADVADVEQPGGARSHADANRHGANAT